MEDFSSIFKAYDVRGKLGSEINEDLAYKVGNAVAEFFDANTIIVGHDARESSPSLSNALSRGICDYGANVLSLGLSGTEEVYAAVAHFDADVGIEVTASHNPIDYNGFKIVKNKAQPIANKEFLKIQSMVISFNRTKAETVGKIRDIQCEAQSQYIDKLLTFVNLENLKPFKIVINSGNGAAGPVVDKLSVILKKKGIKFDFIKVNHDPDPAVPNGIPNPLLIEQRGITSDLIKKQ